DRRAAESAVRAGDAEAARRHLAAYADAAPDDVDALLQLAALHRSAGAVEALAALLSGLWPRLSGEQARAACRELVELSLELHRPSEALDALRRLVELSPDDAWALETLVSLLPPAAAGAGKPKHGGFGAAGWTCPSELRARTIGWSGPACSVLGATAPRPARSSPAPPASRRSPPCSGARWRCWLKPRTTRP